MPRFRILPLVLFAVSCSDPTRPDNGRPGRPALESIPFEALGASGKIAFARTYPGTDGSGVYVLDVAARTFTLIPGTTGVTEPAISPDGQVLAYTAFAGPEFSYELFTVPVAGGPATRLTTSDGPHTAPSWTPDGAAIIARGVIYANGLSLPFIYRQAIAPPQRRTLWTAPHGTLGVPGRVLPGSRIAMSVNDVFAFTSGARLYTVTLPDTEVQLYAAPDNHGLHGAEWSPDGSQIAFVETVMAGGVITATRIRSIPAAGGAPVTIVEVSSNGSAAIGSGYTHLSLCWLGADRIVFSVPNRDAALSHLSLWVVRTDGSGLTRVTTSAGVGDGSVSC